MIDAIVIAIIIILAVIIALFFYRNNLLKKLSDAKQDKSSIMQTSLKNEIDEATQIKLNGESLDKFNEYKSIFDNIFDKKIPQIDEYIKQIQTQVSSFKLLSANSVLEDINQLIKTINHQFNYIHEGLIQLKDVDNQHHQAIDHIDSSLREINQRLLSQNYSFGPSSEKLEDRLQEIKKMYHNFVEATKSGNQDVAEVILSNIYQSIDVLNDLMDKIPDYYVSLSKEYPKQLDEIERGHRTMIQTGYNFSDDSFADDINTLQQACTHGLASLSILDLKITKKDSDMIENKIDNMYSLMEQEVIAKRKVKKNMNLIYDFIFHAKNQNRILIDELNGLSKNYTLEHNELESAEQLTKKINVIESTYSTDFQSVSECTAIFSIIQKHQQEAKHQLSAIEKQQRDINESVADLNEEEQAARDKIQKYDLQLLTIRRQVDNLNLPGLTDEFLERYDYAYEEVSKLGTAINKTKISMDEINQRLDKISKTMNTILSDTDKIIDSAVLAERLMQYANRYRNSNKDVNAACMQAKEYFDRHYQYEKSLSVITTAIEKVDSGAYKQIENEYYNEKSNSK
jgi:septation ring formation regulator